MSLRDGGSPALDPAHLEARFTALFRGRPRLYRAPGRVNLIGEHTDYNDGFVMPTNTALYTWVAAAPRGDRTVRAHSALFEETVEFSLDGLAPGGASAWAEYLKGVAAMLLEAGVSLCGADLLIDGDLPLGGGLSSSASLEAAAAVALLGCAGGTLEPMALALACQRAEHDYAGVPCGIMDQAVIIGCPRSHAMLLDCRSLASGFRPLPETICLLVVDSGVKHRLSDGGYRQRRGECDDALEWLAAREDGVNSYRDVDAAMLQRHATELDEAPLRRARHVVSETRRVLAAADALERGDRVALGAILDASHASLRDDFAVSCREVDFLVATAQATRGVFGARMVGGGFGGCMIALVDPEERDRALSRIADAYRAYTGRAPWRHVVAPASPAGAVEG
ncbi:MAG: galactokinase [Xanthomonadales bacterium]